MIHDGFQSSSSLFKSYQFLWNIPQILQSKYFKTDWGSLAFCEYVSVWEHGYDRCFIAVTVEKYFNKRRWGVEFEEKLWLSTPRGSTMSNVNQGTCFYGSTISNYYVN